MDLFDKGQPAKEPLAARMRPRNLFEYIGQDHIIGKGRLLRRAIAADQLTSVIFYGPPGTGKTTLARVIANHTKSNFLTLNAVLTGVADIRESIRQADEYYKLYNRRTILFVDEVHRWNKSQQDALLPWVENGTIILIGATTENPFFEVNKALVSRSRVFQLKPLTAQDLRNAAENAIKDVERGYGHWNVEFESGALEHLIETANGDARSLLNALELAVETTPEKWNPSSVNPEPPYGSTIYISKETAEESIQKKVVLYDKDGDYHYDIISAFIKSLRGRDPDAAMYWLARMVRAGEDPHFIFRRMLISACEDTGLADPFALSVVTSCADAFDRVGLPEGRYHLAHAALYLATAPKSNSSMAFFDALSAVEKEDVEVPNHLRDGNRDAEGFGHGEGYMYPHAYRDHWVAQQYLPTALVGKVFYNPTNQGYESKIRDDVLSRRELQIAAFLGESFSDEKGSGEAGENNGSDGTTSRNKIADSEMALWAEAHFHAKQEEKGEHLTFSPKDARKESALERADKVWRQRLDSNKTEVLLGVRNELVKKAELVRHTRSLIWNADDGLLLWEVARKTPEGFTCGLCRTEKGLETLKQYGRTLEDLDKPLLLHFPFTNQNFLSTQDFKNILNEFSLKGTIFDRIFFRDPFNSRSSIDALSSALGNIIEEKEDSPFADDWKIVFSQKIPCHGQRISALIKKQIYRNEPPLAIQKILEKMEAGERSFFGDETNALFNWDDKYIRDSFQKNKFEIDYDILIQEEKRSLMPQEIERWFAKESIYGKMLLETLGETDCGKLKNLLVTAARNSIFNWTSETVFGIVSRQGLKGL